MRIHRLFLVLATTALLAQTAPKAPAPQAMTSRPAIQAVQKGLSLSDQQVQQLVQLRRDEAAALRPLRQQVQDKRKALATALQANPSDPAIVGQLTLDIRSAAQQLRKVNEDYHTKALNVLDASQQAKLKDLQQAARERPAINGARALNLLEPQAQGRGAGMGPMAMGRMRMMRRMMAGPGSGANQ